MIKDITNADADIAETKALMLTMLDDMRKYVEKGEILQLVIAGQCVRNASFLGAGASASTFHFMTHRNLTDPMVILGCMEIVKLDIISKRMEPIV